MLASRRAKKRVSALDCMRLRSDVAVGQHLAVHCNVYGREMIGISLWVGEWKIRQVQYKKIVYCFLLALKGQLK